MQGSRSCLHERVRASMVWMAAEPAFQGRVNDKAFYYRVASQRFGLHRKERALQAPRDAVPFLVQALDKDLVFCN